MNTNNGILDDGDDDCEDYVGNEHWCGRYDTWNFKSLDMCCACGGGNTDPEKLPQCVNTNNGAVDVFGDGCDEYVGRDMYCGKYDLPDFKARDMCCTCGGGKIEQPAPEPE